MANFVKVVMGAEVAGANHNSLLAEGGANEVRIHTVNIEANSGVGGLVD